MSSLSLSLTHVIQELLVGEALCLFTCATLFLQEQAHAVPQRIGDAAAPPGLCDPQQLTHTSRDDLQGAQQSPVLWYCKCLRYFTFISWGSHTEWLCLPRRDCGIRVTLPETNKGKPIWLCLSHNHSLSVYVHHERQFIFWVLFSMMSDNKADLKTYRRFKIIEFWPQGEIRATVALTVYRIKVTQLSVRW